MSLRLRVALFTALGTSALLVVGVAIALSVFRDDQIASIDATLESQHALLSQPALRAARLDRPLLESLAAEQLLTSAAGVRVWAGDDLVVEAGPPDYLALPPAAPGHSTVGAGWYRVFSDEVEPRRDRLPALTMEVAVSMDEADTVYDLLRQRLRRLVLAGALLFGLAGWAAAAGALAPLARLRRAVEGVAATGDLAVTVSGDGGPREVRDLADSFDAMLARLRRAGLEKEETLEAARVFAAAAAHELRTPLTSIGANLELLRNHPDTPDREDVMGDLDAEHRRVVGLIESLRLLARGDLTGPEAFEEVDLADIVEQSVARARRLFPDATFEVLLPDGPMPVWGWPEGLRLAVDNLIANAATHGRRDGRPAEVTVGVDPRGVALSVADRGPGIEPAERESVLGRFSRGTTAQGEGSGLGLALVAQQARIHAGTLAIGDTPGGGATVTLRVPAASPSPNDAHRVPTS
jgi:two-component system sensor histidine kinase PrrB